MKRTEFLKKGIVGLGGVMAFTALVGSKDKSEGDIDPTSDTCATSPRETRGPFPNKTPADYVRENITGDRNGVALLLHLNIVNKNANCKPLSGALVDIWHCDSEGNYSEYGGNGMNSSAVAKKHFLRGRQTSDDQGRVSFISIFPGHYQGRAPHIHIEVLNSDSKSLLATQIAFPTAICNLVYTTQGYKGGRYVSNFSDMVFSDSLDQNMADLITGDPIDGYILNKTIVVVA